MKEIDLWEVRAFISQGNYETALARLAAYKRRYQDSYISNHLRGVAYSLISDHPKHQGLASVEFSRARRNNKNWETTYAYAAALIGYGKTSKAKKIVQEMQSYTSLPGRKFWNELLRAQYYSAANNHKKALSMLQSLKRRYPSSVQVHKQLGKAYRKASKGNQAYSVERRYDDLRKKARYLSTKEGISSPVEALALAQRPIE